MIMNTQLPPNTQLPGSAQNGRDNETGGKRAIEVGFPIVEINRLAVPERVELNYGNKCSGDISG